MSSTFTVGLPFSIFIVQEHITDDFQKATNGYLAYKGVTTFYASGFPGFEEQEVVYTTPDKVQVSFLWQAK